MDEPVRLNAAQMASRNVKSAKGRRKAPLQSNPAVPQSMSFGGGGGGLFGGSVQAAGTFDFSAPSGGLSFPPSPFGSNNAFGNSATSENDDPRADTTGEEAARRNKAFRDAPARPASTPVQSNIFGQSQHNNPFSSMKGKAEQANNPFAIQYTSQPVSDGESKSKSQAEVANNPFTIQYTSQPASPGFTGFNSAPAEDKPTSNIFAFGGTPSHPASPSPNTGFSSGPSQDKTTSNLFTFGGNATQPAQPASSIFNFGSPAPQDKPASGLFSFNQNTTQPSSPGPAPATQNPMSNLFSTSQPSSSGINFGFAPATEKPTANMFGTSQPQPMPSSNLFAPTPQSPASSTNIFAHLSAPASPSNNLFSSQQEPKSVATANNLFGGQNQQPPTTSNLFGSSNQTPASSNLFGGQNSATPSNSLFPHLNKPAETSSTPSPEQSSATASNSLFSHLNKPAEMSSTPSQEQSSATPSNSLFSRMSKPDETSVTASQGQRSEDPSTNSLFSNLNKPVQSTSNLFGIPKSAPASNFFGGKPATSTNDLFGNLNKPVDQPAPQSKINGTAVNGTASDEKTSESSTPLFNKTPSSNIFGGSSSLFATPASQAEAATGTTPNFSFGTSQPSAPAAQTNGKAPFSPMKPIDAPSSASQPPPSGMFPNLSPTPSKSSDASNKSSTSTALTSLKPSTTNTLVNGNTTEDVDYDSLYAEMAAASSITDQQLSPMVPAKFSADQKNEFYTAYRLRSLNKAIEKVFGSVTFGTGISNLIAYYNQKKVEILDRSSLPIPGSKRRSSDNADQDNENPSKRSRQNPPQTSSAFQPPPSTFASKPRPDDKDQENENPSKRSRQETLSNSNIFQTRPQAQTSNSPEKSRSEDQPYLNGGSTPKAPLFAPQPSFASPAASSGAASFASPSTKSKRKAEVQLTKDDDEREEQEGRWKQNSNTAGSTTSNMFKSIVDSPSKASPGKKVKSLPSASPSKEDAPRINPFSNLPVPKSPTKAASSPTNLATANATLNAPTTNIFSPKPAPDASNATTNMFAPKPASNALNLFAPKPASNTPGIIPNPNNSQSGPIKPPQFGPPKFAIASGASALAQFAAKAKQSEEEKERKLLEEAVMDEFDSDEDEEVVKAFKKDWMEKRKADKEAKSKELEEITKNVTGFVPEITKELVTQPAADYAKSWQFSAGNSISNSRTSTPGPVGSSTGSVLDGPAPMFGGNNIFGHLSDSGSGANSVQGEDEDEDDTESNASSPEEDSENKDPDYEPGKDTGSGPGTPVEETGPGIASTKKAASTALFASGSSTMGGKSGESSDSGSSSRSIFDRISRDSNGNPIRQLPTDDKENTQPSTTNPKAPAVPADQTWSPNSPIRFASTTPTPSNNANPTVSVTEATPTKAPTSNIFGNLNDSGSSSPFPNLFGNSTSAPATSGASTSNIFGHLNSSGTTSPLPNLFGNSTNKATTLGAPTSAPVGFQFTSATSSLFPSAAASTTTSRATSPGNTTDGANDDDSATEDADAEKHEQLDLTAGGPGVEDENIVHEVRAKALQFISAEGDTPGSWKTKGVGPLRLLKHKGTGATRLLLRGDPTGNIVFNKSLLAKINYTADKKTVKILAAAEGGNGLETWLMQVKTAETAEDLAKALESNKPSE